MIEVAVVFDHEGRALAWHDGVSAVSIPDDPTLWDLLWRYRQVLAGIAHTHPGDGVPRASHEDVTTFDAIERALGRRLAWPIASTTHVSYYGVEPPFDRTAVPWLNVLRQLRSRSWTR